MAETKGKKGKKGKKSGGKGVFLRGADQWFVANFPQFFGLSHKKVDKKEKKDHDTERS